MRFDRCCVFLTVAVCIGMGALSFTPYVPVFPFFGIEAALLPLCFAALYGMRQVRGCTVYLICGASIAAAALLRDVEMHGAMSELLLSRIVLLIAIWAAIWRAASICADCSVRTRMADYFVPLLFGVWLLFVWQVVTVGFGVPEVLLPSPEQIGIRLFASTDILWDDFVQTFVRSAVSGYVIGNTAGFLVAVCADRVPFLRRGLLPIGNFVSALPIVGIAPIMIMWFGFDWQSKAAVVVAMTFFPMLVHAVTGLAAAGTLEKELLHSYGASFTQTLLRLRLPTAMPFLFTALKLNATLALIGAIVAEFFGTPIVGMGFRIATEIGRMNVDMVWAEITIAALAGSAFYGVIAFLERRVTFWHPSYRTQ